MERKSKLRSSPHNRFYHSVLRDCHQKALAQHLTVEDMNFLKQGLKQLDNDYPNGISTSKITDKQLVNHIEFIVKYLGQFGITPSFVEEEWERLKKLARI